MRHTSIKHTYKHTYGGIHQDQPLTFACHSFHTAADLRTQPPTFACYLDTEDVFRA
jgi:hypothetical protein